MLPGCRWKNSSQNRYKEHSYKELGWAHTACEVCAMLASAVDWKSKRETLRTKRDLLFKRYLKNPHDSRMALEIKNLDDKIAECTEHMDLNLNKAKQR